MTDQRQLTAFHEAAHAVVAVSVGGKILEVSIRPSSGDGIIPDSVGHMENRIHPDPRPEDCWSGSRWFQTWAIIQLAGYVIEELLDPDWYFRYEDWDHHCVIDMLREFSPREPEKGVRLLADLRDRTRSLLIRPEVLTEVTSVADLLLVEEEITGKKFYDALYDRKCSARNPSQMEIRCCKSPHAFGSHLYWTLSMPSGQFIAWEGLPVPWQRQRVGSMTGSQKRIRAINLGQAPRRIPKAWRDELDEYARNLAEG